MTRTEQATDRAFVFAYQIKFLVAFTFLLFGTFFAPLGSGQQPRSHDFRGIGLGITVSELKALPMPETDPALPAFFVSCSDEPKRKMELRSTFFNLTDFEKDIGVLACEYGGAKPKGEGALRYSVYDRARIKIGVEGDLTVYHHFKFVALPNEPEPKLFSIYMTFTNRVVESVKEGLIHRFGKPKTSADSVTNVFGATFKSTTYVWENELSSVILQDRGGGVDTATLAYELKRHINFLEQTKTSKAKKTM